MNPQLKTFLDAARTAGYDHQIEAQQALRNALHLAGSNKQELAFATKYLLTNDRWVHSDLASTFVEALREVNGLESFVESINGPEEFHCLLKNESVRPILSALRNHPAVRRLLASSREIQKLSSEEIFFLCDLGQFAPLDFFNPAQLRLGTISVMLERLKISPDKFLVEVAPKIVDECLMHYPQEEAGEWLGQFLMALINYYGEPAVEWITKQIEVRRSARLFWEAALSEHVLDLSKYHGRLVLTSEQREWFRAKRANRLRREIQQVFDSARYNIRGHSPSNIVIQAPIVLTHASSDFPGHVYRPFWSWLLSEPIEAAIYSWLRDAGDDLVDDYNSPEDGITSAFCAYMKSRGKDWKSVISEAWQSTHPNENLIFELDYVDCRKGRDVGGADLVLVLSVDAPSVYKRTSFIAIQCKKLRNQAFRLTQKELLQKDAIRTFTQHAYYLLYPCASEIFPAGRPTMLSAGSLDAMLRARATSNIEREVLLGVGRRFEEYFVSELLAGWSGDDRWKNPNEIRERVERELRPVRILSLTASVVPVEAGPTGDAV